MIHQKILTTDLADPEKGELFSKEEVDFIKAYIKQNPSLKKLFRTGTRTSAKDFPELELTNEDGSVSKLKLRFSVIIIDGIPVALYTGKEKEGEKRALGSGGFSEVKLGQNLNTGSWISIKKQIKKAHESEAEFKERIEKEYALEKEVGMGMGVVMREDAFKSYIITELGKGPDLFDYLELGGKNPKKYDFLKALDIAILFAEDLENRFHKNNILHRDIKSDNALFNNAGNGHLRIIDLGLAFKLEENNDAIVEDKDIGTEGYQAPEILTMPAHFSKKSDIYALGKVFKETFFEGSTIFKKKGWNFSPEDIKRVSYIYSDMLFVKPNMRPTLPDIITELKETREKYLNDLRIQKQTQELFESIEQEDDDLIEKLLSGEEFDFTAINEDGDSLLMAAVRKENEKVIKQLIEKSVNVNYQNEEGISALMIAAETGNDEVILALLQGKPDVNLAVKKGRSKGLMALMLIEDDISLEAYQAMLDADAKVNVRCQETTPLNKAIELGREDLVEALMKKDANPNIKDLKGKTELDKAVATGNSPMVRAMLQGEVFQKTKDKALFTAIDKVLQFHAEPKKIHYYTKMIEMLLAAGANLDAKNVNGVSARKILTKSKNVQLMRLLYETNVDEKEKVEQREKGVERIKGNKPKF